VRDTRWLRGRLKSISLLGNVIAALEADEQGDDDAILYRDGVVTEGTATNVFLWSRGRFVTPSLDSAPMLAGVTRRLLIDADPSIIEQPVTVEDLRAADEVMLVGTKTMVSAVTHIDRSPVGSGRVGPASIRLLEALRRAIARDVAAAT
jgi:D-alanine transaminase